MPDAPKLAACHWLTKGAVAEVVVITTDADAEPLTLTGILSGVEWRHRQELATDKFTSRANGDGLHADYVLHLTTDDTNLPEGDYRVCLYQGSTYLGYQLISILENENEQ